MTKGTPGRVKPSTFSGRGAVDVEGGFVPDVGGGQAEVHVVGEEWRAGGGVGAGDGPVVGAGAATIAAMFGQVGG